MKKVANIFLVFFTFIFFLTLTYLINVKYFVKSGRLTSSLDNISLVDKINIRTDRENEFIDNINKTYNDLINMDLDDNSIRTIEKYTNLDQVLVKIINNKIKYVLGEEKLKTVYSKEELDKILTKKIKEQEVKQYILDNDYKIIDFEKNLNKEVKNLKNDNIFDIVFSIYNLSILAVCFLLVICFTLLLLVNKVNGIKYIINTLLVNNIFNIVTSSTVIIFFRYVFRNSIINYLFDELFIKFFNQFIFISIMFIILLIILSIIYSILTKDNSDTRLKPRIEKRRKDEEDFNF